MDVSRRAFLKAQAASAAAGISLPAEAQNIAAGPDIQIKWSKAPCRFCGTGCGVMVGVKDGRVVAPYHPSFFQVAQRGGGAMRR